MLWNEAFVSMARAASQPHCDAADSYQRAPNPAVHHFLHLLLCVCRTLNCRVGTLLQKRNLLPIQPGQLFQLRYQDFIFRAKIADQFVRFSEGRNQALDVGRFVWRRHKPIY